MKKFLLIILANSLVFASSYYSKLEPIEKFVVKSDVSGKVIFSDLAKEGSFVKEQKLIQIDDKLDKDNLKNVKAKIASLNKILKITKKSLENLKKVEDIKKQRYEKYLTLSTKSLFDKNNELMNLISSQNQTLSLEQSIQNTKLQISDLRYQESLLEDTISKKSIIAHNMFIDKINIKKGDFVSMGMPLYEGYDISKGKLTIFLTKEDLENINNLNFYIEGKKQPSLNYKVWNIADAQNISAYRCEIIVDAPKYFSKLVKIELKKN